MNSENKIKIIIIDDHPFIREGIKGFLQEYDRFIVLAELSNAKAILNGVENYFPDIIILDINMPGMNGLEACLKLKDKFSHCKILAHTAYNFLEENLKKHKFDGYLIKNSDPQMLVQAIDILWKNEKYFPGVKINNSGNTEFDRFSQLNELTKAEFEIMRLIAKGYSNTEIADMKHISLLTVKTHRKNIYTKTKVGNTAELINFMIENGISFG